LCAHFFAALGYRAHMNRRCRSLANLPPPCLRCRLRYAIVFSSAAFPVLTVGIGFRDEGVEGCPRKRGDVPVRLDALVSLVQAICVHGCILLF
jgi:hypothetical protein